MAAGNIHTYLQIKSHAENHPKFILVFKSTLHKKVERIYLLSEL